MSDLKLPDFREHGDLNELRRKMSATLVDYDAEQGSGPKRITRKDLERLQTTGIIVNPEEIETLANGIFSYQGVPVLLYIFQPTHWNEGDDRLPRYHVCNCRTWKDMKAKGRSDRYVASTRVDGYFELDVYIASLSQSRKQLEQLKVCQNCLDQIRWKGFANDGTLSSAQRSRHVAAFALAEFFEHYNRSLVREKPKWTPSTMPSASYSDDFDEISSRARAAAKWRCQAPGCGRLLAASWQRRYLHVHHRNGVKGDNSPENLMVICLECHAKQPGHEHMRNSRDLHEFKQLFHGPAAVQRERIATAMVRPVPSEPRPVAERSVGMSSGASRPTGRRLVDRLRADGLKFKDLRPKGSLWVIGGAELKPYFAKLSAEGITFIPSHGGKATGHRPGWWTSSSR